MARQPVVINVHIWGYQVGAVALDPNLGRYVFEYAPAWRRRGIELAPLTMPVGNRDPRFTFPNLPEPTYKLLPGMLADALPDDFGNALVDAWMASHGISLDQITTLDRLAYMGKRAMGALEFRPASGATRESQAPIEMQALVEEARHAIHANLRGDREAQAALANIIRVGTSAGGARAKAVIALNEDRSILRSGQFDVAPGFSHWLLKFDGIGLDQELGSSGHYGRIEYAYAQMAREAGIEMSDCGLLEENGRAHFITRRFDRDGNEKLHLQSLCAMRHLDYKQRATHAYEQLFITADQLALGAGALQQLFLRMAFNVAARNQDDHTKNFAFLMRQGQPWTLAPAYDVTYAYNPAGEWTATHLMSVNGKFDAITRADLLTVASRFSIGHAAKMVDQINAAVATWPVHASRCGVPNQQIGKIAAQHLRL